MEASAAGARGGSLPMPSSNSARKEWRAVSENSVRNTGNEELERVKLGQTDERTIYEGTGPVDVDFCSMSVVGGLNDDLLQQRLHSVSRQREELQQMEIELRAQVIARSDILEMQKSFDSQIKEHMNAAAKLKEQLEERELRIHELEATMEEKDRELHAIKIDNEAAWAKEDLLREQNKELATFRRERDNSEVERAQHLKQIYDLKEHIHEKENQFLELEEQHRAAQETILYRDEQLREAQAWVARVQEMDALQSTANQSLQAELRERNEQLSQLWHGCQRQFQEMERHHMHVIQQLQLELVEARERSGISTDDSQSNCMNLKDTSSHVQNKGNQCNVSEGGTLSDNSTILPNGSIDKHPLFVSDGNAPTKTDHVPGVPVDPSSVIGMSAFLPPGQVTALHSLVMPQQGAAHTVPSTNSNVLQTHVGHFQPIPSIPSHQQWQPQQALPDSSVMPNCNQYQPIESKQGLLRLDVHYDYELSTDGHAVHSEYQETGVNSQQMSGPTITSSSEELEVLESHEKQYLVPQEPHQNLQDSSSQFQNTIRIDTSEIKSEPKEDNDNTVDKIIKSQEVLQQHWSDKDVSSLATQNHQMSSTNATDSSHSGFSFPQASVSARWTSSPAMPGKAPEVAFLDERSLLACIVRAIPAGSGGRIRISTTLPNRLGKMLAPLHWHDYKKQYGKLDDFVSRHPELFVIEGDFIHLREGAQGIISATTAVAKVAAAAAVSGHSSLLPTVAVTPVAQTHRLKKDHSNGVLNVVQGLSNIKILNKLKDSHDRNGFSSEMRTSRSSELVTVVNGANLDRTAFTNLQNNGLTNGRQMNFGGKSQERTTGAGLNSRR